MTITGNVHITRDDLVSAFEEVGIERGDTVYVASSLMALGLMNDPVGSTQWALQEAVGPRGTLVMPAFNFDFCSALPFDREHSPAQTGALPEAFRVLPGVQRTWSPPYHSVTVLGSDAGEIAGIRAMTSFGSDSVFQHLHDIDAKHLLIGCGYQKGVPHFHWLEERFEVPYRHWKRFEGDVIIDGRAYRRAFFQYVRSTDRPARGDAEPLGRRFEEAGLVRETTRGLCRIRQFGLRAFAEYMDPLFAKNPCILLPVEQASAFTPVRSPVIGIHHIGITSRYADRIRELIRSISLEMRYEGLVHELGVNVQYFEGHNVRIEFVDAATDGSTVSRYQEQYPACPLHHIAFEVEDMDKAIAYFASRGYFRMNDDRYPGPVPHQATVFLSPAATGGLLTELVATDAANLSVYHDIPLTRHEHARH
jgi:aminoglycoside 3-N-acetyltransferase